MTPLRQRMIVSGKRDTSPPGSMMRPGGDVSRLPDTLERLAILPISIRQSYADTSAELQAQTFFSRWFSRMVSATAVFSDEFSSFHDRNGSVSMKTGIFIPWVSFSYCESEPQTFAKILIQNLYVSVVPRVRRAIGFVQQDSIESDQTHYLCYELSFIRALPIES